MRGEVSSSWRFPSISAIRQAALEIGGVASPKEGLVVGRDVVKDDDETEAGAGGGLLKLGREITKDRRLDEVCFRLARSTDAHELC